MNWIRRRLAIWRVLWWAVLHVTGGCQWCAETWREASLVPNASERGATAIALMMRNGCTEAQARLTRSGVLGTFIVVVEDDVKCSRS